MLRNFVKWVEQNRESRLLVFVCGPYKSASSLLTLRIEEYGFENPCHMTTPGELSTGRSRVPYQTAECGVVRSICIQLMGQQQTEGFISVQGVHGYLKVLNHCFGRQVVVKCPHFLWTIEPWCAVAREEGFLPYVAITRRQPQELREAWAVSQSPKRLLEHDPAYLEKMVAQTSRLPDLLGQMNVPYMTVDYAVLKQSERDSLSGLPAQGAWPIRLPALNGVQA